MHAWNQQLVAAAHHAEAHAQHLIQQHMHMAAQQQQQQQQQQDAAAAAAAAGSGQAPPSLSSTVIGWKPLPDTSTPSARSSSNALVT